MKGDYTSDTAEAQRKKENDRLMALFLILLSNLRNTDGKEEALEELAGYRSELMIGKAIVPFGMDVDEALQLLRSSNDDYLTQFERDRKDRLIRAIENIIEFCACGEYQAMKEAEHEMDDDEDDIDFSNIRQEDLPENSDDRGNPLLPYWLINRQYNSTYRTVEEEDAGYAMQVCEKWLRYPDDEELTYMTQNDDRVRPWHYALQGFTAPKKEFPGWMIPPIEWGCRCFLLTQSGGLFARMQGDAPNTARTVGLGVCGKVKVPKKPKELDGVFEESICTGGRIFGEKHPYFSVEKADRKMLGRIVDNIKGKWYVKK